MYWFLDVADIFLLNRRRLLHAFCGNKFFGFRSSYGNFTSPATLSYDLIYYYWDLFASLVTLLNTVSVTVIRWHVKWKRNTLKTKNDYVNAMLFNIYVTKILRIKKSIVTFNLQTRHFATGTNTNCVFFPWLSLKTLIPVTGKDN